MRVLSFFASSFLLGGLGGHAAAQHDPTTLITAAPEHSSAVHANSIEVEEIQKRSPPAGVYVCSGPNWTGECAWHSISEMTCANFPWTSDISFGPPNGWQCKFYYSEGCTGQMTPGKLTFPGTTNFAYHFGNEVPKNYKCRPCPSDPGCINNNAPDFFEAQAKLGEVAANGKCSYYSLGNVFTRPC
ncbi:hypothetical protein EDD37DRAFT_391649 [Exophiala viscosa]|uniref:Secreted protein n=1 Tax=Exophiala viscosa TaxID=2486360 RepID=A0AAN6E144_9EURO|nr:hypothetical protein EDD36DRAFT_177509 [Exophiala viscosa]KAI1623964.1 hypothetical protein EDD37DRAFT_391649 [Exophiala viscosa]